jgi:predicted DNA-binding transcriptional regulator YafY
MAAAPARQPWARVPPAIAARPAGAAFNTVAHATLKRQKLWLEYHARSTDEVTERMLSPQCIVHYREAWYLDAWDEGKDALRSSDRIRCATVVDERAFDVPEAELDDHYLTAYGINAGFVSLIVPSRASIDERVGVVPPLGKIVIAGCQMLATTQTLADPET